jgi:two-component system, OmpR family, sensor kinase
MFTSFARRLTAWYVVAAVVSVAALLGALAIVALFSYVHFVSDGIDADARQAEAFSLRAVSRGESFVQAATEIETRFARSGIRMVATGPFPPHPDHMPRVTSVPLLIKPAGGGRPPPAPPQVREFPRPITVFGGRVVQGDPRSLRLSGSRIGFALGTLAGARVNRLDFVGGELAMLPDPDATLRFVVWLMLAALGVSAAAGVLAWLVGRYITSQVLQPLVEVTRALQRFAGRDFSPQAIAVAGKSDFDAIALAYNAAAAQVAAAFAERHAAETQMRQFVADAGHELRTPLTIVLGYIDLLRRKANAGDERSRRIFASIGAEGARMRTLIDNLVLLARMEGEDVRPTEPFALGPLLDEIVDARRVLAPGVRFALDVPVAATVIGSRDEIHEAIANVVDNAIKYAPGAPIRIAAAAAEGGVEVTVADDGPGIHPEDRATIFDRFYRGATRGEVEGSGLGLAIAKRAVERAGGTLELRGTGDDGTTFAFRLRTDGVPTAVTPSPHV